MRDRPVQPARRATPDLRVLPASPVRPDRKALQGLRASQGWLVQGIRRRRFALFAPIAMQTAARLHAIRTKLCWSPIAARSERPRSFRRRNRRPAARVGHKAPRSSQPARRSPSRRPDPPRRLRAPGRRTLIATPRSCTADEEQARDELARRWTEFAPARRTHCTQVSSMSGFQSYVELITCLEMAEQAEKLPKR